MKNNSFLIFLFSILLIAQTITAQVPGSFNYQALVRDAEGVTKNTSISLVIEIIQGSVNGNLVYSEEHDVTTNNHGLVNVQVGKGTTTDTFANIDWSQTPVFIQTKVNNEVIGSQELVSVPYSMLAKQADKARSLEGYETDRFDKLFDDLKELSGLKVTDYDGNEYEGVVAGGLIWMTTDMKATHYSDGRPVPYFDTNLYSTDTLDNFPAHSFYYSAPDSIFGEVFYYNSSAAYDSVYPILGHYPMGQLNDTIIAQGICPDGWRIPNKRDVNALLQEEDYHTLINPVYFDGPRPENSSYLDLNFVSIFNKGEMSKHFLSLYLVAGLWHENFYHVSAIYADRIQEDDISLAGYEGTAFYPVRCVKDFK